VQFPRLKARDLEGRTVEIPDDLNGALKLIVLAFKRDHQYPVESWLPHLDRLEEGHPGLTVWEVPALSRSYRIWRGAIDGGMRAGIPDPKVRRHTLTTYTDLRGLQRALELPDLEEIYLLLLDGSGRVLWRTRGAYSEQTLVELTAALEKTGATSAPDRAPDQST
jgi:hypothetical protein